ncbi:unnamed protein product [Merluccius merluccius]
MTLQIYPPISGARGEPGPRVAASGPNLPGCIHLYSDTHTHNRPGENGGESRLDPAFCPPEKHGNEVADTPKPAENNNDDRVKWSGDDLLVRRS